MPAEPTKPQADPDPSKSQTDAEPLRSVHTSTFPQILEQLGISVLVSTYQAGKLIVLRNDDGCLNTHFRTLNKPMGMASIENRLAIGTALQIWEFRNVPEVGRKQSPIGKHDACFLPRAAHVTGDIDIHEMAFSGDDLWIVNTRFSCLCTVDRDHSFRPRWRPSFVSALAPEDRCHLNGLALVDGEPKYVTALGRTDSNQGWRENKAKGGVLIDVPSGELVVTGLSMPHSPRWYDGKLWVLESGAGAIGTVDRKTGRFETVAEAPGFTRGLDFCGPLAFIGLSQVRESAVFSGIPITERLTERNCGVWVVNILTGQTVAFVKFEDAVQEIFAVQTLPGIRYPDLINDDEKIIGHSYVLPDEALSEVAHPKVA